MSLRALLEDTTAYELSPEDAALLEELRRFFPDESLLTFISQDSLNALALSNFEVKNKDYRGADLKNADFAGADLSGVDFSRADLSGADLRNANLKYANLQGANL